MPTLYGMHLGRFKILNYYHIHVITNQEITSIYHSSLPFIRVPRVKPVKLMMNVMCVSVVAFRAQVDVLALTALPQQTIDFLYLAVTAGHLVFHTWLIKG